MKQAYLIVTHNYKKILLDLNLIFCIGNGQMLSLSKKGLTTKRFQRPKIKSVENALLCYSIVQSVKINIKCLLYSKSCSCVRY